MPAPLFRMYITKILATDRTEKFINLKHQFLSNIINKQEAFYIRYTPAQMIQLFNKAENFMNEYGGLRIYFATYKRLPATDPDAQVNNALIPEGADDLLTLIFAPTLCTNMSDGNQADTGDYFVLEPSTGNFINLKNIAPGVFTRWTQYYDSLKRLPLSQHLNIEEAKSMWYEHDKITNFNEYISYTGNNVTAINTLLASYKDDDNASIKLPDGQTQTFSVPKKLTLVFSIEKADTTAKTEKNVKTKDVVGALIKAVLPGSTNADTGVPCPPKCV